MEVLGVDQMAVQITIQIQGPGIFLQDFLFTVVIPVDSRE